MSGLVRGAVRARDGLRARRPAAALAAVVLTAAAAAAFALAQPAEADGGCRVSYSLTATWRGGFTANVTVTELGSPSAGWTLAFTLPGDETVSQRWNAAYSQSGQQVTATGVSYNAGLRTGETTSIGFNGAYPDDAYPGSPTSFTLDSTPCVSTVSSSPATAPAVNAAPPPAPTPTLDADGHLFESSGRFAQYRVGGYAVSNDEWGNGYDTQTVWVDSATKWGLAAVQPDTPGVKSYANISKDFDVPLDSLSSATSSFDETNPVGGDWESAYDVWLDGNGIEVMAWTYVSGNAWPLGHPERTVTLGGDTWTLFVGDNGHNPTYSFVRHGNETKGGVDILGLLKYLENTGHYFSDPQLSSIQYGWEISSTGGVQKDFTMNGFSADAH